MTAKPALLFLLACALLCVPSLGSAQPKGKPKGKPKTEELSGKIRTKVVDVAGGRAYLEPGAKAGLRTGDTVEMAGRKYTIVAVSPSNAAVELGKYEVGLGTAGVSVIDPYRDPAKVTPLPKPASLAAYRGSWPGAELPALTQHPKPIPLGPVVREERSRVQFGLSGYAVVPTSGDAESFGRGEVRGVLHYEPIAELPMTFDADIAAESWLGGHMNARAGSASRPLLRVRMLQAAYGNDAAFLAALGRLRYASSSLGTLDGVKLRAPIVGGLSVGAFGGFVADPLSGAPSTQASRFGGEIAYEDAMAAWRPRAVVGGHVSRFEGGIDERRLNVLFDLNPEAGRIGAYAETSFFDKNNPWNAPSTELSAAGLDAAFHAGAFEVGGRVGMQRPERSRWLASFLPPEWLCIAQPTGQATEPCFGNEATYVAGIDTGLQLDKTRITIGGTGSRTEHTDAAQVAGYGNVRLLDLIGRMRLDTGVMGSSGSLLQTAALTLSPGVTFWDGTADASVRYRPALVRYEASTEAFIEHAIGAGLSLEPTSSFDIALDGDYYTGRDLDALIVQLAMVWQAGF